MWERECVKNHPKCKSRCANTRLPKRVLDVSLSIRLVETLEPPGTYVALSHCWGKKRIITTTTDTLEERKTGIPFESLSKTFQDAVAMTRRLGYRYLWIDSMCIIQDDSSDWQQESSKMARIYTDAHVVISASASADGDGGCFSIRGQGLHRRTAHFQGPAFGEAREPWTVYVREAPSHSIQSTSRQQDPQLPLFSRAWAYQERLLATRILHFAKDELVWECRSSMTCECRRLDGDIGFKVRYHNAQEAEGEQSTESRKHLSVEEMYRRASRKDRKDLLRSFRNKQHEAVEADPWQLIVTNFSKRLLTKQLDRLPALSGLVKATEHSGTGKYVAGLWSKTMIDNIVWQNSNAQRTSPFYGYIAPSWSWAALPNCIPQFYPPSDILDATILNISCTPSGADPTGALSSGHMDIRGPLQKATLFYQDSDFDPNNRFPKHINRRFYISLDSLRDSSTYSVPPDLDISNYKGVFGTKAGALRTLKVRNYRTLLDISDTSFLDDSLPSYLPPASSVYCLLIGRVKAISCREEPIYNPFGGGWTISKDDEYLRALVLRESVKVLGAFERIGILDPDPTRDNPHPFYANDGKHPMLDHSRRLFGEAKETIVRVV
jgi:hypothetical protein